MRFNAARAVESGIPVAVEINFAVGANGIACLGSKFARITRQMKSSFPFRFIASLKPFGRNPPSHTLRRAGIAVNVLLQLLVWPHDPWECLVGMA